MATFLIWQLVLDALAPLGADAVRGGSGAIYFFVKLHIIYTRIYTHTHTQVRGGSGAIYFFVKLPDGTDDIEIVERLTAEFGVCP